MLERASACLDSGVRLSLRAQRRAPKSRRLLHSTFWHHAAGDLDLPPYLVSPTCPPPCPSSAPSQEHAATLSNGGVSSDGPFLDFLYPAQTLAFMSRVSATHLDRIWDRRAAHKASAKGLRGYSSMPVSKSAPAPKELDGQFQFGAQQTLTFPSSLPYPRHGARELSDLISTQPQGPQTTAEVVRAWDMYITLPEQHRQDPTRISQLLVWLSKQPSQSASAHTIQLFSTLPQKDRTPATYESTVAAYLAMGRLQDAMTVLDEATSLNSSASNGSDLLMLHAITHEDWKLALDICHRTRQGSNVQYSLSGPAAKSSQSSLHLQSPPWTKLGDAPDLATKLVSLAQHHKDMSDEELRSDLLVLFEHIWCTHVQLVTRKPAFKIPGHEGNVLRRSLRLLFLRIHDMGLPSPELYEQFLIQAIKHRSSAAMEDLSGVVVSGYKRYRESTVFQPTRPLLQCLIDFWRDQKLALAGRSLKSRHLDLQTYIDDLDKFHDGLDVSALITIMDALARSGVVQGVRDYAKKYTDLHPRGLESAVHLWPLIYVHATTGDFVEAANQLHNMNTDFGVDPDLRCWNIVIHAHGEANNLEGALATLNELLRTALKPDAYTFAPVLNLYAKQGDADKVDALLAIAKSRGIVPNAHMLNSLIVAHMNNEDIERAEQVLEETVALVNAKKADGSLTMCFNTILTGHSLRRNIDAAMMTYRRMRDESIPLDGNTYGALIQVLCMFRQTPAAHKIVRSVMRSNGVRPLAFHYAIIVVGYVNQKMYREALEVEGQMTKARVRPTNSTRAALLKAKALLEHEFTGGDRRYDDGSPAAPLQDTVDEFMKLLDSTPLSSPGGQPAPGFRNRDSRLPVDADFLVFIHGKRRAFEAAQKISEIYMAKLADMRGVSEDAPPLRLVTALMSVHFRAHDYKEVDRYWRFTLAQADSMRTSQSEEANKLFSAASSSAAATANPSELDNKTAAKIPPASQFILSRPFRYYLASQFSQDSLHASGTMTVLMSELLSQGFRFDNRTWNAFIVHLCKCTPPRALLAFSLVEKFLIGNWPGWVHAKTGLISNKTVWPKKSARDAGVEYLRNANNTRYRSPGTLVPQYKTMVYLANTFLELRDIEATGAGSLDASGNKTFDKDGWKEAERQVGSVREIQERAPRTLRAVQSMPTINDRLQQKLMRG